jgi:hypothetical protein
MLYLCFVKMFQINCKTVFQHPPTLPNILSLISDYSIILRSVKITLKPFGKFRFILF